ncbi:ABC transporter ATP-binding protein [Brevibacterium litoralis]|uniref:ABC transporter ATP-binding protein n=1 Tax=Brevibacterium litoralis TaxID=3138935 RepID=UPI0032EC8FB6
MTAGSTATPRSPRLPAPISGDRIHWFIVLVVIGVGQAAGALALAQVVQWVFDRLIADRAADGVLTPLTFEETRFLIAGPVIAVLLTTLCRAGERVVAERVGQSYVTTVRALLFSHLTTVPTRALGRKKSGSLLQRFVGDLSALRSWVSLGLARLLVAGVAVGIVLARLVVLDLALAGIVAGVLFLGALATLVTSRALVRTSRVARKRRSRLSGEVSERLLNVGVVQTAGQVGRERKRVDRKSTRLAAAMISRARAAGAARGVAEATSGIATLGVVLAGSLVVARGDTTPGEVVGAMTVVGMLAAYLRDLGRVAEYASGAKVAREAARKFLAIPPLADDPTLPDLTDGYAPGAGTWPAPDADRPAPLLGHLEMRDVTLDPGVKGITVSAEPGQIVAIVGPNGAGKSTLMSLAARLLDPDSGQVLLDGQDVRQVNLTSLRKNVGVMSPDLPLMSGSLRRNLTYRNSKASKKDLAAVVTACEIDTILDVLPEGWDSQVGEGGRLLSSGQRARVALARAMLGDPRLLVLDEADAHLDPRTREVLTNAVRGRTGTTLVITHNRDVTRMADQVWHVRAGHLVEAGPTADLLAGDGPTARLFADAEALSPPVPAHS